MKRRTRVKICGLTRAEDVRLCCELGADALGFILVEKSPRRLSLDEAADLVASVGGLVQTVALMMNPSVFEVERVVDAVRPSMLQFHGDESGPFCDQFNHPYIKAISHRHIHPQIHKTLPDTLAQYAQARAFIIDSHQPGQAGGSGKTFDWSTIPGTIDRPWLLAGGLGPGNAAAAIEQVAPYGIDLASGVEREPGVKDAAKLNRLFEEVQRADSGS